MIDRDDKSFVRPRCSLDALSRIWLMLALGGVLLFWAALLAVLA